MGDRKRTILLSVLAAGAPAAVAFEPLDSAGPAQTKTSAAQAPAASAPNL